MGSRYIGKAIIGSGILSLPVALDACGWILGCLFLAMFGVFSYATCHFVAVVVCNFREFVLPRSPFLKRETSAIDDPNVSKIVDTQQSAESHLKPEASSDIRQGSKRESFGASAPSGLPERYESESQLIRTRSVPDSSNWQVDATNLSEIFFGHRYMWVLDAVVFIMTWASSIPYFQLIGEVASKIITINLKVKADDKSMWRTLFIIIAAVGWYPFLLLVSIVKIGKYTNLFGIFAVIYCAVLAMALVHWGDDYLLYNQKYEWANGTETATDINTPFQSNETYANGTCMFNQCKPTGEKGEFGGYWKEETVITNLWPKSIIDFLAKVPTFAFAYGCQFSLYSAYNEMGRNAVTSKASTAAGVGCILAGVFYMGSMIMAYGTFGGSIEPSFMDTLHDRYPHNAAVVVGQILLFVGVSCGLPVYLHAARNSFLSLCRIRGAIFEPARASVKGPWGIVLKAAAWRAIASLLLVVVSALIAITVTDLSVVSALVGIVGSTPVVFIIPAF